MFAYVKNGVVQQTVAALPREIAAKYPTEAARKAVGIYEFTATPPTIGKYDKIGSVTYAFANDAVTATFHVIAGDKPQSVQDAEDAKAYAPLAALANMTPAQVQSYIQANVTDLASAKAAIKTLAVAVGILARRL